MQIRYDTICKRALKTDSSQFRLLYNIETKNIETNKLKKPMSVRNPTQSRRAGVVSPMGELYAVYGETDLCLWGRRVSETKHSVKPVRIINSHCDLGCSSW